MIYIQSHPEQQIPHHFDAACAMYGAIETGQSFRLTSFEEVASGKFDALIHRNLFVGSTEFMREVFKRIDINDVRLPRNSNRYHDIITLGEAKKIAASGKKIFIKPVEIKLFTGFVLDTMQYSCLASIPHDTLVMAYEPFKDKIYSEWRLYIHNNKIIDSRNYSGDFMVTPKYSIVDNLITNNKRTFPCAYTIDIGILSCNENVVIEFNDMWAIGNYGIPNDLYLRMLKDRYFEIVATN